MNIQKKSHFWQFVKRTEIMENTTQKKFSTTQKPIGETAQKILDLLTEDPYLTRQAQ